MNNKSLKDARYRLYKQSTILQQAALDEENMIKSFQLKERQDKAYKKWKFYDNFIKAQEKIK